VSAGTMCAVACALTRERVHLQQYLTLLLRDEMVRHMGEGRSSPRGTESSRPLTAASPRQVAHAKMEESIERLKEERRRQGRPVRANEPLRQPMTQQQQQQALQGSVVNVLRKLHTIAPAPNANPNASRVSAAIVRGRVALILPNRVQDLALHASGRQK
jgi:hypothetical protein